MTDSPKSWSLDLDSKPDFDLAMQRINAWYEQEMIDRPPIQFVGDNNLDIRQYAQQHNRSWPDLKSRWFDVEFQVDYFIESIKNQQFLAETFPVFWPNLGPEVYSAFYGCELDYQEATSYSIPMIESYADIERLSFDPNNAYFQKIIEMTNLALEKCPGHFMVGYTDFHPGMDCVAGWRDPQQLCLDMILDPDLVKSMIDISLKDFQKIFNHFDAVLKKHNQLSVTWMGVPSYGKMHIPSCDFSSMISPEQFDEFCLPILEKEIQGMSHNIFHVDGKGVARHLDKILEFPEINAIQWVQGEGPDRSIIPWVPLIQKIQNAGKSVMVILHPHELEEFINAVEPKGIYLFVDAEAEIQTDVIKRVEKW